MKEDAIVIKKEKPTTIWENKENSSKEDCRQAPIAEDKEDDQYIDSGCSIHMTGDKKNSLV